MLFFLSMIAGTSKAQQQEQHAYFAHQPQHFASQQVRIMHAMCMHAKSRACHVSLLVVNAKYAP